MSQKSTSRNDDDRANDRKEDPAETTSEVVEDAEIIEEKTSASEAADAVEPELDAEDTHDLQSSDHVGVDAPRLESGVEKQDGSSLLPMVLGGVIAAALGAVAVYVTMSMQPPPVTDEAFLDRLATLEAASNETPEPVVPDDVITAEEQAALDALHSQIAALNEKLEALDARVSQLVSEGITVVGGEEGAAVAEELARMQAALSEQRAENEVVQAELAAIAASASAEIEAAEARAAALQAAADAQAAQSATQSVVARIVAASETGAPFSGALSELAALGAETEALVQVSHIGIPTLLQLQRGYPEAARAGLAESLKATMGDGVGERFGAFLRAQIGARSLEAREGTDPDAILSRAEASLGSGDVKTTLSEIASLPEAGQAAMAEWVTQAEARLSALDALDALLAAQSE